MWRIAALQVQPALARAAPQLVRGLTATPARSFGWWSSTPAAKKKPGEWARRHPSEASPEGSQRVLAQQTCSVSSANRRRSRPAAPPSACAARPRRPPPSRMPSSVRQPPASHFPARTRLSSRSRSIAIDPGPACQRSLTSPLRVRCRRRHQGRGRRPAGQGHPGSVGAAHGGALLHSDQRQL